jgi:hypothetical protein
VPTVDKLSPASEQRRSLRRRQPGHPEIADEIVLNWPEPYFDAVPCIHAMRRAEKITDRCGMDGGESPVRYFLVNARTWRGEVAKRVKAELKEML